ncbi:thioredoxin [Paenibacillus sp. DYY-L-2]|uniref:thioredoxin n=1 Tax=Paenibacillus sp. DYY-L-2 TaxID=3447013 RepID=UPI003F4FCA33
MSIKRISTLSELQQEVTAEGVTLVDFDAPWCPPCKVLGPILEEIHEDYAGRVHLLKVNCDEAPELASSFGVMSMPTVIFFHGGEPVEKLVGLRPREAYERMIMKHQEIAS